MIPSGNKFGKMTFNTHTRSQAFPYRLALYRSRKRFLQKGRTGFVRGVWVCWARQGLG